MQLGTIGNRNFQLWFCYLDSYFCCSWSWQELKPWTLNVLLAQHAPARVSDKSWIKSMRSICFYFWKQKPFSLIFGHVACRMVWQALLRGSKDKKWVGAGADKGEKRGLDFLSKSPSLKEKRRLDSLLWRAFLNSCTFFLRKSESCHRCEKCDAIYINNQIWCHSHIHQQSYEGQ